MSTAEVELQPIEVVPFSSQQPFQMPEVDKHRDDPRYLFTAANMVTAEAARDRKHLRAGGVEIWNPCLRTSEMFVRRGRITPVLLDTLTPIPTEEVNTENTQFFVPQPTGHVEPEYAGPLVGGGPLLGYPARPGDQIANILASAENVDGSGARGLVEITELAGYEYQFKPSPIGGYVDPEIWEIQKAIFPNYPVLPVTLAELRFQIEEAVRNNEGFIRNVASEALVSCDIFGAWATRAIEEIHQAMNNAAALGYVFPYETIHFVLLEQLGMERQDLHYRRVLASAPQQPIDPKSLVEMFKESISATRAEGREELKLLVGELFNEFRREEEGKTKRTKVAKEVASEA